MGFWVWVGLIGVLVLAVPVVEIMERMKNRSPVTETTPAFTEEGSADEGVEMTEEPAAENVDGNFGFDGGGEEFGGFGGDEFK